MKYAMELEIMDLMMKKVLILVITMAALQLSYAQLTVSKLFSEGAILQRDVNVPIWGKSNPGDSIFLFIGSYKDSTQADENGRWESIIAEHAAGGPYELRISDKTSEVSISDIYFGDVWLASGQSNMEWSLNASDGGSAEGGSNNDELQREFKIQKGLSKEVSDELPTASWRSTASSEVGSFSAVAYYFAKELRKSLDIPIGIVNNSYGGARIEAFMSEEMLGYDEDFVELQGGTRRERQPTLIYNKMVNPLLRFPFKGIIWYQGESNADFLEDAKAYGELFRKMIDSYRIALGRPELPFLWVQLPNNGALDSESTPNTWDAWPQLREGQTRALTLPNTGEATAIDLGSTDIHPTNKKPVGERLSLVARNLVYGEDIPYSGPRIASHFINGDTVVIHFDFVEDKLMGDEDNSLKWFSIAGTDNILFKAKAVIDGNEVKVWSDKVASPQVVRYAWEKHPAGVNFYNSSDLPAVPFYLDVNVTDFIVEENFRDLTVARGSRVDLEWKVFNANYVTINGEEVYHTSGASFYPLETTTYELEAQNSLEPTDLFQKSITVTVMDPEPSVSIVSPSSDITIDLEEELTFRAQAKVTGGTSVVQVSFLVDGNSVLMDTEEPYEYVFSNTIEGDFQVAAEVLDSNGNSSISNEVTVTVIDMTVLGVEEVSNLQLFPNPTSNHLYFDGDGEKSVIIRSLKGQVLISKKVREKLNVGNLPRGIYIIQVEQNGYLSPYRFIKQ